jgi:hypothetical protein
MSLACAGSSLAQSLPNDSANEPPPGPDSYHAIVNIAGRPLELTFNPGAWFPRLGGEASLGPSPAAGDISFENGFDLDQSEATFAGDVTARYGDHWEASLSGFSFSTDNTGQYVGSDVFGDVALSNGETFSSSIDIDSVAVDVGYWFDCLHPVSWSRPGKTLRRTDLRFAPAAGARYVSIDHVLSASGETSSGGGDWLAPYVGVQMQLHTELDRSFPLVRAFEINGAIAMGPAFLGDDIGSMVQLHATMTAFFTPSLGVTFGYRLLGLDVSDDDYDFSATLEGLFFGATIKF